MNNTVSVGNRQATRLVNSHLLRKIARVLWLELSRARSFDLSIYLVAAPEMTQLNETFLRHKGSTDVLAFDYTEAGSNGRLSGEIFICVDEALIQAARFKTSWQNELVRYLVHGSLHLMGYGDDRPEPRREMRRQENRLLKELARRFEFAQLHKR